MSTVTIYHNPRCSKSRQTLALLEEHGVKPVVVEYLKTSLQHAELMSVLAKLDCSVHGMVRTKEAEYKEAGLCADSTDETVIAEIIKYPKLLERPIVVTDSQAVIGRPPENVLALL